MADQTDFKHITVNPAEPDDIVIHAGAPTGNALPSQEEKVSTTAAPEPVTEAAKAQPEAPSKPSSDYQPTTLEDIQGFKMSKTQLAVIIIALAAIVAAVVWYLVFS